MQPEEPAVAGVYRAVAAVVGVARRRRRSPGEVIAQAAPPGPGAGEEPAVGGREAR